MGYLGVPWQGDFRLKAVLQTYCRRDKSICRGHRFAVCRSDLADGGRHQIDVVLVGQFSEIDDHALHGLSPKIDRENVASLAEKLPVRNDSGKLPMASAYFLPPPEN